MANPFKDSEFITIGVFADGALIIEANNSERIITEKCKASDWFLFWGSKDKNLINIISLKNNDEIDSYANYCAIEIEKDTHLAPELKRIYSELYREYFSKVCPVIQRMAKKYEYIRVFYNKMDKYMPKTIVQKTKLLKTNYSIQSDDGGDD